jgi:peroxiredoxin
LFNHEGQRVPQVTFRIFAEAGWYELSTADRFDHKTVVVFAGTDPVCFIPDVKGDFTRKMGMMVNLADKGMGQCSRRYSMLVKDGMIEKMFVERDGFEAMPVVSNAETMLNYLNPEAQQLEQTAVLMQMWRMMRAASAKS